MRPEYYGNLIRSPVTGRKEKVYSPILFALKKVFSVVALGTMVWMLFFRNFLSFSCKIVMVLAAVVSIFFLRAALAKTVGIQYASYISAFLNFIQIQIFNFVHYTLNVSKSVLIIFRFTLR
jgi:hypothetical protein